MSTADGVVIVTNIVSTSNASFDSTGGALTIDAARIGSTLTLSANGDVTLGALAVGANLSATSDAGSVPQRRWARPHRLPDIVVDGVQAGSIGFESGPAIGDAADERVGEAVADAVGATVDPDDFALQLSVGGDAAFDAAGSCPAAA